MPEPLICSAADIEAAARTLDGECRGEPLAGQQAVAWVIRTRATWDPPAWWGHSVGDVCKKPYQFSCWLGGEDTDHILRLDPFSDEYQALKSVVLSVMNGEVDDPTAGATHYEVVGTGAAWARGRTPSCVIGHHAFYRIGP